MKPLRRRSAETLFGTIILAGAVAHAVASEPSAHGGETFARQVTFKLTFSNRDVIWHGDPASPNALLYVKPGAQPIATDVQVTTTVESDDSPSRRYMREARIAGDDGERGVYAFTTIREKVIGTIDAQGRFAPNEFYDNNRELLPTWPADASVLAYDPQENALYYEAKLPGPRMSESADFLPLELHNAKGEAVGGTYSIGYKPYSGQRDQAAAPSVRLVLESGGKAVALATATLPKVFRRADVLLGSFDNQSGTYLPEAAYRPGPGDAPDTNPSVTFEIVGEFAEFVEIDAPALVVIDILPQVAASNRPAAITIDGNFDDWRNVPGVNDPRGDVVPYLEYVPDVDLLEFKVAHDEQHLYLYARVAGQVGRSHPDGGRSYFYAYIDVDQDPGTGFLPSRDDECYWGVDIGDDCEVQFEFVGNQLRKTFYGFCGLGGDDDVLRQVLSLGKSQYGRFDNDGNERAHYKSEYIYRDGVTEITEDLKLGTSDTIRVAISPDGSEVEIASTFTGFLKDRDGKPILGIGQTIDLAAGMECDSKNYPGKTRWAADSTPPIRGYHLRPIQRGDD